MDTQKIAAAIEMARSAACNLGVIEKWHPSVTGNPIFVLLRAQLRSAIDYLEGGDGELRLPCNDPGKPTAANEPNEGENT